MSEIGFQKSIKCRLVLIFNGLRPIRIDQSIDRLERKAEFFLRDFCGFFPSPPQICFLGMDVCFAKKGFPVPPASSSVKISPPISEISFEKRSNSASQHLLRHGHNGSLFLFCQGRRGRRLAQCPKAKFQMPNKARDG